MQGNTWLPQGIDSENPPERAVLNRGGAVAFPLIGLSVAVALSRTPSPCCTAHTAR
jgi:hypothetical protein